MTDIDERMVELAEDYRDLLKHLATESDDPRAREFARLVLRRGENQ